MPYSGEKIKAMIEKWLLTEPVENFETLTFGDLKVGEKFIYFPDPGDNSGHGGFKRASWIFMKTEAEINERGRKIKYRDPHGKAINIHNGNPSDISLGTPILILG